MSDNEMLTWQEALDAILEQIRPLPTTNLPLEKMLGCVLAEPVVAPMDSPLFDNSAVDGFAVKVSDVAAASAQHPVSLRVSGQIRAGEHKKDRLRPGCAIKILTGAFVPGSVDAIVMKEHCQESNGKVQVARPIAHGENIRRRGAEFLRGHTVLPATVLVTPPVVGLLASMGYRRFTVHRRPKAAIVTTGSELTRPGKTLLPGRIYDSNSYAVKASLEAAGVEDVLLLHAAESPTATRQAFKRALAFADVIVSTGGVSVGDYDYVKEALGSLGVKCHIWRIAMKPGKPVFFGVYSSSPQGRCKYIFGLPGNPVSALVTFNIFVLSALSKLAGLASKGSPLLKASLSGNLKKKAGRAEFVRARLLCQDGKFIAAPVAGQDSHMLSGLALSNALIVLPLEAQSLVEGETVEVRRLQFALGE